MLSQSTQPITLLLPKYTHRSRHGITKHSHSASQREDGIVAQKREVGGRGGESERTIGGGVAKLQGNELKVEGGRKGIEIALLPSNIIFKNKVYRKDLAEFDR